jgi:oligopeptide transport system permease protein
MMSLGVIIFFIAVSLLSLWFTPHNPNAQTITHINLPPRIPGLGWLGFDGVSTIAGVTQDRYAAAGVPADVNYWLGTDGLGRDLLSRLLVGIRVSLSIAGLATVLDLSVGIIYGLVSGLNKQRVDTVLQRFIEVLAGIPTLVVLVLLLTVLSPGLFTIAVAMVITGWIPMARLVRAQALRFRDQEFIVAAQALGASRTWLALRHVLPNSMGVIVVQTMFSIPSAIFFEAFLSFIGLGLRPPMASLGTLLNEGFQTFTFLPFQMLAPMVALSVLMVAFNLLADGLRDAFDPKGVGRI